MLQLNIIRSAEPLDRLGFASAPHDRPDDATGQPAILVHLEVVADDVRNAQCPAS